MSVDDLKVLLEFDSFQDYFILLGFFFAAFFGFVCFCKARIEVKGKVPLWYLILVIASSLCGVLALSAIVVFYKNYDFPTMLRLLLSLIYGLVLCVFLFVGMLLGSLILQPMINAYYYTVFQKREDFVKRFVEPAVREKATQVFVSGTYCEYTGQSDLVLHFDECQTMKELNPFGQKLLAKMMKKELSSIGRYSLKAAESRGFYSMTEEELKNNHFYETGYELTNISMKKLQPKEVKVKEKPKKEKASSSSEPIPWLPSTERMREAEKAQEVSPDIPDDDSIAQTENTTSVPL